MLIEFSLENFRSIRERQTLSMVAAPRLKRKLNTFKPLAAGEKLPPLLKVVAIYGPNASGKSNLVKGLRVFPAMLRRKASADKEPLPVAPFRFDPELRNQPSRLEIHFIEGQVRYGYELALTPERVNFERLIVYPKGLPELLYQRELRDGHEHYTFGEILEGGKELHEAWRRLTPPQLLFLAQAVANSSEELNQLRHPFSWLEDLMAVEGGMKVWARFSQHLMIEHPRFIDEVVKLLSDVDVPVSSIKPKLKAPYGRTGDAVGSDAVPGNLPDKSIVPPSSAFETKLTHRTALGEAEFDWTEESDGTVNMLGFALPWFIFRQADRAHRQSILIIDELDSSLHPKLVEALVRKHLEGDLPCQLVFTTHDTHLMDTKLLRRDQIWMTERDVNGATQLRSVHDFEGREGEDIEKRYYEGRYRALPLVREL